MKAPQRISIALDQETSRILNELKESYSSVSELFRELLKFHRRFKFLENEDPSRIRTYVDMLSHGEHIILDIDHWLAFLKFISTHPDKEKFWEIHKRVSMAHAEEFVGMELNEILRRLEACNFFRISMKDGEYALVFGSDEVKEFVKKFLEGVFEGIGIEAEIKEELAKLRIKPVHD